MSCLIIAWANFAANSAIQSLWNSLLGMEIIVIMYDMAVRVS